MHPAYVAVVGLNRSWCKTLISMAGSEKSSVTNARFDV
jgi:hypothetical protein